MWFHLQVCQARTNGSKAGMLLWNSAQKNFFSSYFYQYKDSQNLMAVKICLGYTTKYTGPKLFYFTQVPQWAKHFDWS